jgi:hypothetical protein
MASAVFEPPIQANKRQQAAQPLGTVFLYVARCIQGWRNPYHKLTQLTLEPAAFRIEAYVYPYSRLRLFGSTLLIRKVAHIIAKQDTSSKVKRHVTEFHESFSG